MLNKNDLKTQIQAALSNTIPKALSQCMINSAGVESDAVNQMAKEFEETFDELVSEPLAESLAGAIDYYVKNATITGTIITVGSMTTQTAAISPAPNPVSAGKIPNTLGIS